MAPNIELTIDQLVIEGYTRNQAYVIKRALTQHLNSLYQQGSSSEFLDKQQSLNQLSLPTIHVKPNTRPEHVGRSIANQLYQQLSSPKQTKSHVHNKKSKK